LHRVDASCATDDTYDYLSSVPLLLPLECLLFIFMYDMNGNNNRCNAIVRELVRSGADPRAKNTYGRSLLDHFEAKHLGPGLMEIYSSPAASSAGDSTTADSSADAPTASTPSSTSASTSVSSSKQRKQRNNKNKNTNNNDEEMAAAIKQLHHDVNQQHH
jgi:hypothetical protein